MIDHIEEVRKARRGLRALYLEVPQPVATDVEKIVEAAFRACFVSGQGETLRGVAQAAALANMPHLAAAAEKLLATLPGTQSGG